MPKARRWNQRAVRRQYGAAVAAILDRYAGAVHGPNAQRHEAAFVIARTVFWIGYRVRPIYPAAGMSATGYLNAGLLGYGIWRMIAG